MHSIYISMFDYQGSSNIFKTFIFSLLHIILENFTLLDDQESFLFYHHVPKQKVILDPYLLSQFYLRQVV